MVEARRPGTPPRAGPGRRRPRNAYRVETPTHMLGSATGGSERFFQQMGAPADTIDMDSPPYVPDLPRMQAAAQAHNMRFMPDFTWPDA